VSAPARITVGAILGKTLWLLRHHPLHLIVALLLLTLPGVAIDIGLASASNGWKLNLLIGVLGLILQFGITLVMLGRLGLRRGETTRFWAFFLLAIVTSLGIALGTLLLIVPGIVLFARWSIAIPAVVAGDESAPDALAESWNGTRRHFWPILAVLAAVYAPALTVVLFYSQPTILLSDLAPAIALNLLVQAPVIAGWCVSVAIYALVRGQEGLSEIFE
jgi:hypothetical protein